MTSPLDGVLTTPQKTDLTFADLPSKGIYSPTWIDVDVAKDGKVKLSANLEIPPEMQDRAVMGPVSTSPYLLKSVEGTDQFMWIDMSHTRTSYPFTWDNPIKRFIVADVEADGDYDVYMEYQDGSAAISYNVVTDIQNMDTSKSNPILTAWLNNRMPGYSECFADNSALQMSLVSALVFNVDTQKQSHDILESVPKEYETHLQQRLGSLDKETKDRIVNLENLVALQAPIKKPSSSWSFGGWFDEVQDPCQTTWDRAVKPYFDRQVMEMSVTTEKTQLMVKHKDQMGFGIGARLRYEKIPGPLFDTLVKVEGVMEDQPAANAGLMSGDYILSIDGVLIKDVLTLDFVMTHKNRYPNYFAVDQNLPEKTIQEQLGLAPLSFIVPLIAGEYGSSVDLGIQRGDETLDVLVERKMNLLPFQ